MLVELEFSCAEMFIWKAPSRAELKELEAVEQACRRPFESGALRIVAFSDYRVQDISLLVDFVAKLEPKPNLILYAGDDVERFQLRNRNFFEELAALSTHGLCAVLGNDPPDDEELASGDSIPDTKTLRGYIRGANVYNAHITPLVIGKYAVIGSEGSPPDEELGGLGVVIYSEASIARHLQLAAKAVRGKHLIVVSHCPPRGILDLALRFGRRRIGSVALRKFLSRSHDVPLVVCGHVHFCGGQTRKFNRSMTVNAASHDDFGAPGKIAIIEMRDGQVRGMQWHALWELASVCGIGEQRAAKLKAAGICNVLELADASAESIKQALKCGTGEASSIRARASSLLKQDAIVINRFGIPEPTKRAYIDIETDPNSRFVWLVGLHLEEDEQSYAFFAKTPAHEGATLTRLLRFLENRPELQLLSYSNSATEQRLLPQRFFANGLPTHVIEHIRDIYYDIHGCAAFPVPSTTLKDVSQWCGFKARHPDMDGYGAAISYGSGRLSPKMKKMLIEYNEDDLLALKHIVRYLEGRNAKLAAAHAAS